MEFTNKEQNDINIIHEITVFCVIFGDKYIFM